MTGMALRKRRPHGLRIWYTRLNILRGTGSYLNVLVKLAADVNVSCAGVHSSSCDETAFDELMGVTAEDFAVFACTRFTFVSVDDEISWPWN